MKKLRKMIIKYMVGVTLVLVVIILAMSVVIQIKTEQKRARESANIIFYQIRHMLNENRAELLEVEAEYRENCLKHAESIAYIVENQPEVLEDIDELKKIAEFTGVDELHIFDKSGVIVNGTHPQYFGYSFDSGEQIGFFKPMLWDKELKLSQDITPNTAESKMMQYSALWSENEEFILQVGMEPGSVMKAMEKNEFSSVFYMLRVNPGVGFIAIDKNTGEIVGTTDETTLGKRCDEIGLKLAQIESDEDGFHAKVKDVETFCVFKEIDGNYVGRILPCDNIYGRIPSITIWLAIILLVVVVILVSVVSLYMNKTVVSGIDKVNHKLRSITEGNLDKTVKVDISQEFTELSNYINDMVQTLLASTEKMSYILSKIDMHIGVYEYNENMKNVRYTEYIAKFLGLNDENSRNLTTDYQTFKEHMDRLRKNPMAGEDRVYLVEGEQNMYVKVEENSNNGHILGMIMDVTASYTRRKKIEQERDMDVLTGLYNRRGICNRLKELFMKSEGLGASAMVMIDADGLKNINDVYGHEKGDLYLKGISDILNSFDKSKCIAARQGGDEFVVFLYNYDTEEMLLKDIEILKSTQDGEVIDLGQGITTKLKYSLGYCIVGEGDDYVKVLKLADEKMYVDKANRKKKK